MLKIEWRSAGGWERISLSVEQKCEHVKQSGRRIVQINTASSTSERKGAIERESAVASHVDDDTYVSWCIFMFFQLFSLPNVVFLSYSRSQRETLCAFCFLPSALRTSSIAAKKIKTLALQREWKWKRLQSVHHRKVKAVQLLLDFSVFRANLAHSNFTLCRVFVFWI